MTSTVSGKKRTLTRTFTITVEVASVPVPGRDDLVLVYSKDHQGNVEWVVMDAKKYAKAKAPEDIKHTRFYQPQWKKTRKYDSTYRVFTVEQFEAIKDGRHDWYDEKLYKEVKLEFGQELDETFVVLGYGYADYIFTNLDGTFVNRVLRDLYLDQYYDLAAIVKNERNNPDVDIMPESKWRSEKDNPIYYVRGNGSTLNLGLRLTDEQYTHYVMEGERYKYGGYLKEVTILGKYVRPEEKYDQYRDDDEW